MNIRGAIDMIMAIIQARMGATRLPGKVMLQILGMPVLGHVVNRVKQSKLIDRVVVATSDNSENQEIMDYCRINKIDCYPGSENDVLDRFYQTATHFGAKMGDVIVRITADCPLIDPQVIDKVIEHFKIKNVDFASNVNPPTYPDGLDVEVFGYSVLEAAWKNAVLASDREHVTPYICDHPELFRMENLENIIDYSKLRLTLDEKADFEVIKAIYENLQEEGKIILLDDILEFLKTHPQISMINSNIERNEGYVTSLKNDKPINK